MHPGEFVPRIGLAFAQEAQEGFGPEGKRGIESGGIAPGVAAGGQQAGLDRRLETPLGMIKRHAGSLRLRSSRAYPYDAAEGEHYPARSFKSASV